MSSLETPAEETAETTEANDDEAAARASSAERTVDLGDGANARLSIPESATPAEAAAIAAAVGTHRTDRRRAAAAATASDDEAAQANRWKAAARLSESRAATLPRDVERGALWRAASRSF